MPVMQALTVLPRFRARAQFVESLHNYHCEIPAALKNHYARICHA
jgi:hypothetical protein